MPTASKAHGFNMDKIMQETSSGPQKVFEYLLDKIA